MRGNRKALSYESVRETILRAREAFLDDEVQDYEGINNGACANFAEYVLRELGCKPDRQGGEIQLMDVELLQALPDEAEWFEDFMGLPFDRQKIARTWPNVLPPVGNRMRGSKYLLRPDVTLQSISIPYENQPTAEGWRAPGKDPYRAGFQSWRDDPKRRPDW